MLARGPQRACRLIKDDRLDRDGEADSSQRSMGGGGGVDELQPILLRRLYHARPPRRFHPCRVTQNRREVETSRGVALSLLAPTVTLLCPVPGTHARLLLSWDELRAVYCSYCGFVAAAALRGLFCRAVGCTGAERPLVRVRKRPFRNRSRECGLESSWADCVVQYGLGRNR